MTENATPTHGDDTRDSAAGVASDPVLIRSAAISPRRVDCDRSGEKSGLVLPDEESGRKCKACYFVFETDDEDDDWPRQTLELSTVKLNEGNDLSPPIDAPPTTS
jgi:hypothetical protein